MQRFDAVLPQASASVILAGGWRVRQSARDQGVAEGWFAPDLDDGDWEPVQMPPPEEGKPAGPGLRQATAGQERVWYRCRFRLDHFLDRSAGARFLLRFGGAFLETTVWLNGQELGSHYGYFAPFAFDVTDRLNEGENVLAVACTAEVFTEVDEEGMVSGKKHVAGVFNEWDCKPYPNNALAEGIAGREWWVPVGLWDTVSVDRTCGLVVTRLHVTPSFDEVPEDEPWPLDEVGRLAAGRAAAEVAATVQNPAAEPWQGTLHLSLEPETFDEEWGWLERAEMTVPPGESQVIEYAIPVPRPRLWFPWTHGEPYLYRLGLTLEHERGAMSSVERLVGMRQVQADIGPGRFEWRLNGRRIFPKGSNYICDFAMDRVSADRYRRDLEMARAANMDFLRVHAHIERDDFYQLADEAGVLVQCDFPLIFSYVFRRPAEEAAFFREAVLSQVPEMVHLLQTHPSIVLWEIHNEPPWPAPLAWFGPAHEAGMNKEVDLTAAALARSLDASRPTIAASGEFDQHLYSGWYGGTLEDQRAFRPPFPTEYGAQSLPNADSPFWQEVNARWPVDLHDPTWRYADYQPTEWTTYGVGGPEGYGSLEEYIAASQAYQAWFCEFCSSQFRMRKFQPVGGMLQFMFTDCHPAITWAVVDYYRQPKAAFHALRRVFAPTQVLIDFTGDWHYEDRCRIVYRAGGDILFPLFLVNDDFRAGGEGLVRARLEGDDERVVYEQGHSLPAADQPALPITTLNLDLPAGAYALVTEIIVADQVLAENRLGFEVRPG